MEGERLSSSQNIQETAKLIQIKCSFSVDEAAGTNDADDPYSTICCHKTNLFRGNRGESRKNPTCINLYHIVKSS